MTIRQCYEYILVECNKVKAPQVLLEDFIYLFNKAIQQYINSVYNRSEYNQQSSDDLGFLQTTSVIKVGKIAPRQEFNDTVWELQLPKDYLHMLNCIAEFTGSDSNKSRCGNGVQRTITSTCQRLTADLYAGIINNYYAQSLVDADTLDIKIKKYSNITKEEVVNIAKKIKMDTIYILEGDTNEND